MLAFVSAAILSTIQSDYAEAALWGGEGRFSGLILIAAYGFTYFAISRNLKLRQWYLDLFLGAGMLACIMGILQYFKMVPLALNGRWTRFSIPCLLPPLEISILIRPTSRWWWECPRFCFIWNAEE